MTTGPHMSKSFSWKGQIKYIIIIKKCRKTMIKQRKKYISSYSNQIQKKNNKKIVKVFNILKIIFYFLLFIIYYYLMLPKYQTVCVYIYTHTHTYCKYTYTHTQVACKFGLSRPLKRFCIMALWKIHDNNKVKIITVTSPILPYQTK